MKKLKRRSAETPFKYVPVPEHVDVADLIIRFCCNHTYNVLYLMYYKRKAAVGRCVF